MARQRNVYFRHYPNVRNDSGIVALRQMGYRRAYEQWNIILELAIEYNADLNEGKFKINSSTLARELSTQPSKLNKLLTDFSTHLAMVWHDFGTVSAQVSHRFSIHSPHVYQITVTNLLIFKDNRGQKSPHSNISNININEDKVCAFDFNFFDDCAITFTANLDNVAKAELRPLFREMKEWILNKCEDRDGLPKTEDGWHKFFTRWIGRNDTNTRRIVGRSQIGRN